MHQVFFLGRIYPYWALPMATVLWQLAVHFKRRRNKAHLLIWALIATLVASAGAWIAFRGDQHSDDWVRSFYDSQ